MKLNKNKWLIAIIGVFFLFLNSCQTEELIENSNPHKKNLTYKNLRFQDFQKYSNAQNQFNKVLSDLSHSNTFRINEHSSRNVIAVDTSKIIFLSDKKGNHSFTFRIKNNNLNTVQNLVLSSNSKNNYDSYIATYQLSKQEISEIANGKTPKVKPVSFIKTNQKIDSRTTFSSVFDCASIESHTVSLCRDAKGNVIENDGQLGNGCVGMGWTEERVTIIIDMNCFSSGVGGGGDSGGGTGDPILPIGGGGGATGTGSGDSGGGTSTGGTSDDGSGSSNDMSTDILPDGTYTSPILNTTEIALLNNLTQDQLMWWENGATPELKQSIITYLLNNTSPEGIVDQQAKEFVKQIINLAVFKNISWDKITKWYSLSKPGLENDETYDETFWNNPNLTFPQQDLPIFNVFKANFPNLSISAKDLCANLGGEILTLHDKIIASGRSMNTCAIRLSVALNKSGNTIPYITGKTKKDKDGKNYFTFAGDLNKWMLKTFGSNPNIGIGPTNNNHKRYHYSHLMEYLNPANGNILNPSNPLNNIQGIFSMVSTNPLWSTGHCDILQTDSTCVNSCHFEGPIKYIDIWILN